MRVVVVDADDDVIEGGLLLLSSRVAVADVVPSVACIDVGVRVCRGVTFIHTGHEHQVSSWCRCERGRLSTLTAARWASCQLVMEVSE